jgi:hypothetical protein
MASAHSAREIDPRQAALDRASLEHWQRERKALEAIEARLSAKPLTCRRLIADYLRDNPKDRRDIKALCDRLGFSLA